MTIENEFYCSSCSQKVSIEKKILDKKDTQIITCGNCGSRYFLQFLPAITWRFPPYDKEPAKGKEGEAE